MTGTFDDWSKSVELDRKGDFFEKLVELPVADKKIYYKVGIPFQERIWPGIGTMLAYRPFHRLDVLNYSIAFFYFTFVALPKVADEKRGTCLGDR